MVRPYRLFSMLLTSLVLAGCGAATTQTAPKSGAVPQYKTRFPAVAPVMGPANTLGATEGQALLARMRQTLPTVKGFEAEIKSYSEGHFKAGQRVSELRKATTEAKLMWKKPNKFRAEVVQTSNQLLIGAAMATQDSQHITARAKGLLGLIPFHLDATDPKLGNNRNHLFTENNPKAQLERLTAGSAVWTIVADDMVQGTPVKLVAVDAIQHLDREITREVIAIDPQTMGLRRMMMYVGDHRVIDHTLTSFRWNPPLSEDLFQL